MVLGGLLIGLENYHTPEAAKSKELLQPAIVQAANLALLEIEDGDELGSQCISLVLNHSFPLLPDPDRSRIDYDVSTQNCTPFNR